MLIVTAGNNPGGMFPLMIALVYAHGRRPRWLPAAAAAVSFLAILDCTLEKGSLDESGIVYFTGGLGIAWMSGSLLRRQAALTAQVEAMRDAQVEQMAATERARLARDVHDVVAHSLTVVMLNLTGARRALATDPAGPTRHWRAPRSSAATASTRSARSWGCCATRHRGAPRPQPTGRHPRLVDGFRAAGLDVALTMPRSRRRSTRPSSW